MCKRLNGELKGCEAVNCPGGLSHHRLGPCGINASPHSSSTPTHLPTWYICSSAVGRYEAGVAEYLRVRAGTRTGLRTGVRTRTGLGKGTGATQPSSQSQRVGSPRTAGGAHGASVILAHRRWARPNGQRLKGCFQSAWQSAKYEVPGTGGFVCVWWRSLSHVSRWPAARSQDACSATHAAAGPGRHTTLRLRSSRVDATAAAGSSQVREHQLVAMHVRSTQNALSSVSSVTEGSPGQPCDPPSSGTSDPS